ncbi:MAG: hypothetical protein ACI8UD_000644 [Planctomycetota bacterium]
MTITGAGKPTSEPTHQETEGYGGDRKLQVQAPIEGNDVVASAVS